MDTLKAQHRKTRKDAKREARRIMRARAREIRRCFWTRPFGHVWVNLGTDEQPVMRCISCNAPRSAEDVRPPGEIPEDYPGVY